MSFSTSGPSSLAGSTPRSPPAYTARRSRTREVSSDQGECDASVMPWVLCGSVDNAVMTTDRVQHGAAVRVLVEQDLASEQMLALMREAAGLPDAELRRIIAEELVLMEVVGTGPRGVPTSVAAYVSRPDGVVLEYIAVAPGLRGDGIGRALVDALASVSGQVVAETDDDAVGFYRALDFDIGPAPLDPRWPGRRRYRCVRRS